MRIARTRKPRAGHRRSHWAAPATVACAIAIAACGSSSKPHSAPRSSGAAQAIEFADCMRANGVPNFPDPRPGSGVVQIPAGSGINPFSPSFKAAQARCAKLLPGGGPGNQHPSEQDITEMRQLSVCMRQHGVSGFPDPTLSPPSSPAGYSQLEDRRGVILAIPDTIDQRSPVYKQAAAACGFS